jgi:hypothetical protein
MKMRKTILTIIALLIAGSAVQTASASNYHVRKAYSAPAAASEQFRNANNSTGKTFCSEEPGNPYDEQTDYQHWSAARSAGLWDDRNDCQ